MKHDESKRRPQITPAIATLYCSIWNTIGYDSRLRNALAGAMSPMQVLAVFSILDEGRVRLDFAPRRLARATMEEIWKWIGSLNDSNVLKMLPRKRIGELQVVATTFPDEAVSFTHQTVPNICAACFRSSGDDDRDEKLGVPIGSFLHMVFDAMRQRQQRFNSLPPSLSSHYWQNAGSLSKRDRPPWEPPSPQRSPSSRRTTTLCIDMRKSTRCMSEADDPKRFAEWLDEFVQIMVRIAHRHCGIFDKFTGDGALIHFLSGMPSEVSKRKSVVLAIDCAKDIHRAIADHHLPRLRKFLHMDFSNFGIGASIADSRIHWYIDYRNNPITVGRSVVQSTRLCNKTEAGCTTITNYVYQRLVEIAPRCRKIFHQLPFTGKENPADDKAVIFQANLSDLLGMEDAKHVKDICKAVYNRTKSRRKQAKVTM